jgi:5-methylcytosine-specific restriction endonuclease McrA
MPFMKNGKRDYQAELNWEKKKKPNRVKDRAERNRARSEAGLKVGDSRQADHKKPLSEGGAKNQSNVRVVSAKENLTKEANRKKRKARG